MADLDDGVLSREEFVRLYGALGMSSEDASDAFSRLDPAGAGVLSREQLAEAHREYLYGTDTQAPANWLFGRLD